MLPPFLLALCLRTSDGLGDITNLGYQIVDTYKNRDPAPAILHDCDRAMGRFVKSFFILVRPALIERISGDDIVGAKMVHRFIAR